METMLEKVNRTVLEARKAKTGQASFLSTVLARIKLMEKAVPPKELNDENIVKEIKKMMKETKDVMDVASKNSREDAVETAKHELALLETLIPDDMKDVSEEELRKEISNIIEKTGQTPSKKIIGPVMKELKQKCGARFDGKLANQIINKIIG